MFLQLETGVSDVVVLIFTTDALFVSNASFIGEGSAKAARENATINQEMINGFWGSFMGSFEQVNFIL